MRYGSKLLLVLIGLLLIGEVISFGILRQVGSGFVINQMGQQALAIAASAAASLDGDKVELIKTREDEKRPEYELLLSQLRKIRDATRAAGTDIRFLYTLHPSPDNPSRLLYGLDPEEEITEKSFPGDVVHGMATADLPVNRPHIHPGFRTDSWGTWLIGRYPIRNSSGKFVAYLAADIKEDDVISTTALFEADSVIGILTQCAVALFGALLISRSVTSTLSRIQDGIEQIRGGKVPVRIDVTSKDEFGEVARAVEHMSEGLAERDLVKSVFTRYVSKQVADSILVGAMNPQVHGERRKVTVLFSDVRGFTTIAEKLPPEEVVQILNSYFERMVDIIFRNKGMLDKFLGDGLMAVFGAPLDDQFQEENALKAAIEMRRELAELNQKLREKHDVELKIGIGISSGTVIIGNIGSSQRMEYTAIGDTVNLAARLESKTKDVGADILISEYTYNSVRGSFPFEFQKVGTLAVKGRKDEIMAYSVPL